MLDRDTIVAIADDLAPAEDDRTTVPLLTARHPGMTVEDSYAVQNEGRRRGIAAGCRPVGREIGPTSKVVRAATGQTEPDYVEGAFVLAQPLQGPDVTVFDVMRTTEYVVPALEILYSRIDLPGRTIVDTISDNAAPKVAQSYLDAGATFALVGADVAMLARSSEALAARSRSGDDQERASY